MKQSVQTIFRIIEEFWQTVQQNGIPAAMVRDQLPSAALPPANATDRGGVILSDSNPNAVGAAAPGTGSSVSRTDHVHAHGNQAGGALHANATTTVAGFQSAADKVERRCLSGHIGADHWACVDGDGRKCGGIPSPGGRRANWQRGRRFVRHVSQSYRSEDQRHRRYRHAKRGRCANGDIIKRRNLAGPHGRGRFRPHC
jgi:hypothetical protein